MKNGAKAIIAILALATSLSACKGGVSGEKQDSTMLNKQAMDSSAKVENKAGEMTRDTNTAAQQDTTKH